MQPQTLTVLNPDLQQDMPILGHPRQRPGGGGLIGSAADPTEMLGTLKLELADDILSSFLIFETKLSKSVTLSVII